MAKTKRRQGRKVFSAPVKIYATAYIVASSESAARRALRRISMLHLNLQGADGSVEISSERLDSMRLPELSLSPLMTVDEDVGDAETKISLVSE